MRTPLIRPKSSLCASSIAVVSLRLVCVWCRACHVRGTLGLEFWLADSRIPKWGVGPGPWGTAQPHLFRIWELGVVLSDNLARAKFANIELSAPRQDKQRESSRCEIFILWRSPLH